MDKTAAELAQMSPKDVFETLNPLDPEKGFRTMGQIGDAMCKVQRMAKDDPENAVKVANLFCQGMGKNNYVLRQAEGDQITPEEGLAIAKENIGYICGYYGPDMAEFWYPAIQTQHPIFGSKTPTAEEAFNIGKGLAGNEG